MLSDFDHPRNLCWSSLAAIGIACASATAAGAAASVEFTYVPPYGSFSNLQGKVYGVNPATNRIAVFIYLNGAGWFTKPTCGTPLTTIQTNGTWTADITTGGIDQNATRIAAYVVPASFSQPCVTGVFCLPAGVEQQAVASAITTRVDPGTRSIHWSGFDWWVKTGNSPLGPGPNYFSDSTNNVFIPARSNTARTLPLLLSVGHVNLVDGCGHTTVCIRKSVAQVKSAGCPQDLLTLHD